MRLVVRHRTEYHYTTPCRYAIQTLRLTPRPHAGLIVRNWRIKSETPRELPSYIDGYGNRVHTHTIDRPHAIAGIFVEGEVETTDTGGVLSDLRETLPPEFFLRETMLTEPDDAIRELALGAPKGAALETAHRLMQAVRDRIDYKIGESDVSTPAAAALAAGVGVCQDHAQVFIAAARVLGIPARYASGYLCIDATGSEQTACHAWAEAYVQDLGWVGFDPANRVCPTAAYVRLAAGLDYNEAAPVRGLRREGGDERLVVRVQVHEAAQEQ
jgi:transglutaminase-like putative cysteine protease